MDILWKSTVSAEFHAKTAKFRVIRPILCRNCAFPHNFQRKTRRNQRCFMKCWMHIISWFDAYPGYIFRWSTSKVRVKNCNWVFLIIHFKNNTLIGRSTQILYFLSENRACSHIDSNILRDISIYQISMLNLSYVPSSVTSKYTFPSNLFKTFP